MTDALGPQRCVFCRYSCVFGDADPEKRHLFVFLFPLKASEVVWSSFQGGFERRVPGFLELWIHLWSQGQIAKFAPASLSKVVGGHKASAIFGVSSTRVIYFGGRLTMQSHDIYDLLVIPNLGEANGDQFGSPRNADASP